MRYDRLVECDSGAVKRGDGVGGSAHSVRVATGTSDLARGPATEAWDQVGTRSLPQPIRAGRWSARVCQETSVTSASPRSFAAASDTGAYDVPRVLSRPHQPQRLGELLRETASTAPLLSADRHPPGIECGKRKLRSIQRRRSALGARLSEQSGDLTRPARASEGLQISHGGCLFASDADRSRDSTPFRSNRP